MTDEPNDLSIEWSPIGKQMKVTLRVFFRGELIETENVDLANPNRREAFAQKIADNTGVTPEAVESELLAISLKRSEGDKPPAPEPFDDDLAEITQKALEATDPAIVAEAEQMLAAPDLIDRISADIEAAGVAGEEDLRLTLYLIGVSRLLPRPLAGIVQGQSSSGKSYTIERVAAM